MALEVGIVGLPSSGKTTLFRALTRAETQALQSIGRQSMLELIENLSEEQQQVLTLKFVFNFPNADVATILGKTEGAVKSLQHRALVSLQKQIAQS